MKKFLPLLLLSLCATAATAQHMESPNPAPSPPPGDVFLPNSQDNLNAKQVRQGMFKFARCVAGRHPKESSDFVLDATGASWATMSKKVDNDCVLAAVDNPGEEVRISSNSRDLLFSLADALVQKKLAGFDPSQIASAGKLPPSDILATIGECAVRANPGGASDLMKARINSKEEMQAVEALVPAFSSCLPKDLKVHFDITTLRGTVAVNYYRLASAPRVAQSEAQK